MGNKSGKLNVTEKSGDEVKDVATTENHKTDVTGDEVVEASETVPNGKDATIDRPVDVPSGEEITVENGHKDVVEEKTEETVKTANTKSKKKRNPMHWFRKNVSFKKERLAGKGCGDEKKNETPADTEPVADVNGDVNKDNEEESANAPTDVTANVDAINTDAHSQLHDTDKTTTVETTDLPSSKCAPVDICVTEELKESLVNGNAEGAITCSVEPTPVIVNGD